MLNLHTRKQFLRLALGPLDYTLAEAAKASGHDFRDGEEQVKALARKQMRRDEAMCSVAGAA